MLSSQLFKFIVEQWHYESKLKFCLKLRRLRVSLENVRKKLAGPQLSICCHTYPTFNLKVTVQFETEENGQNEIISHMDRSEVKL